jgi:hypothetical protein
MTWRRFYLALDLDLDLDLELPIQAGTGSTWTKHSRCWWTPKVGSTR